MDDDKDDEDDGDNFFQLSPSTEFLSQWDTSLCNSQC